jgi:hypothetical protein
MSAERTEEIADEEQGDDPAVGHAVPDATDRNEDHADCELAGQPG